MSEREWDAFFDLMEKAISMPGLSADEKGEAIRNEASNRGQETTLEEFLGECGEND